MQLIKTVELDTPSSDFTENLLDYLKEEDQFLMEKNSELHQKLDKRLIPSVSDNFTRHAILALKYRRAASHFRPLLSKRARAAILSVVVICSLFFMNQENTLEVFYISERILVQIAKLQELFVIPPVLSISVFALALLLLLDFFLRKEKSFR